MADYGYFSLTEATTADPTSVEVVVDPTLAVTPASGPDGPTGGIRRMTIANKLKAAWAAFNSTRGAIPYYGASGLAALGPGASGYVLTSNGPGADPSYQAGGASAGTRLFHGMNFTAVANTAAKSSLFSGGTTTGSLALDGSTLRVGQTIEIQILGKWGCTASSPTHHWTIQINGADILLTPTLVAPAAQTNGVVFTTVPILLCVQAVGASGAILGGGQMIGYASTTIGPYFTSSGAASATATNSAVTVDLSSTVALDMTLTWGTASSSNTFQVLNCTVDVRG